MKSEQSYEILSKVLGVKILQKDLSEPLEYFNWDSLAHLTLLSELDSLGVKMSANEIMKLSRVSEIFDVLEDARLASPERPE